MYEVHVNFPGCAPGGGHVIECESLAWVRRRLLTGEPVATKHDGVILVAPGTPFVLSCALVNGQ